MCKSPQQQKKKKKLLEKLKQACETATGHYVFPSFMNALESIKIFFINIKNAACNFFLVDRSVSHHIKRHVRRHSLKTKSTMEYTTKES